MCRWLLLSFAHLTNFIVHETPTPNEKKVTVNSRFLPSSVRGFDDGTSPVISATSTGCLQTRHSTTRNAFFDQGITSSLKAFDGLCVVILPRFSISRIGGLRRSDLDGNDRPHHNQQRHPLPDQIGVTKTGRHKHHLHAISESPRNGEFLWNPDILVSARRAHWQNILPFIGRFCGLDCPGVIDR